MKKLLAIALAAMTGGLFAATVTWTGDAGTSDWATGGNWNTGNVPGADDEIVISSGSVVYTAGGDLTINGSLTVTGTGSFEQTDGIAYMQGSGTINITDGGVFSMGTCDEITERLTINIDGGTFNYGTGAGRINGTFNFTKGKIIKSKGDFTLTASTTYTDSELEINTLVEQNSNVITLNGSKLTTTRTEYELGIYQKAASGAVNFAGSSASSFTFPETNFTTKESVYTKYSNDFTLNGGSISASDWADFFSVSSENGFVTVEYDPSSVTGWRVSAPVAGPVDNGEVDVSFTVTKYSGGDATVVIGCASSDLGDDIGSWAGKTTTVAQEVSATTSYSGQSVTLNAGVNYIRVFVTADSTTVASSAITAVYIVYGDYGTLTDVYEYIGTDNDLSKVSNWALDKTPLTDGATVPTASEAIRWFGSAPYTTSSRPRFYSSDYFVGATIYVTGDCDTAQNLTLSNSTFTTSLLVLDGESESQTITLYGSDFVSYRSDAGDYGFWQYDRLDKVNFISGAASTWTCRANGNNTKEKIYTALFDNEKFTLNGAKVDEKTWHDNFVVEEVSVNGSTGFIKITYNPVIAANRIDSVAVQSTSTSATITATIGAQETGTLVKIAYGTTAPTDASVLAGIEMAVSEATATAKLSDLTDLTTYYYLVAIVDAGSAEVLASKAGTFIASDYAHIYDGTSWVVGGEPVWNQTASVLVTGTLTTGEINPANKVLKDAVVTANTILYGDGLSMTFINSTYENGRTAIFQDGAAYGFYMTDHPINFTTASGNGVIKRGDAYTCYATEEQCGAVYANLFDNEKIRLDGAKVAQALFESNFTTNAVATEETTTYNDQSYNLNKLTITYWEPFPAAEQGSDWTIQAGARVKLTSTVKIGALTIPNSADVKIDTNGRTLKVTSLTVNGTAVEKGEYTSENFAWIVGEGSVVVGKSGLAIILR